MSMTQYRMHKRGLGYIVQVRNTVVGVSMFWSDVQWFRTRAEAEHFIEVEG